MPIYAYKCGECGHSLEVIQKVSDPLLTDCPQCGKPALAKQVTAAGFQLKGGGWYVTDFRDSGKKKEAGKTKADEAGAPADSKTESPAETKDASKTESKPAETKSGDAKSSSSAPAPAPAASPPPKSTSSGG
ncbi:MAG: FmdB family zinc ribbon protein [Burkholderiaceae bacterium]